MTLFLALSRYKIKDTYATSQMLDYAISAMPGKGFQLQELKNLMISAEGRPRVDICRITDHEFLESANILQTKKYACTLPEPTWTGRQST
jgi:hypothetical protein